MTMKTMVQLIYASHMASGLGHEELDDIMQTSRSKNEKRGVTGALCYSARGFLQCLEGPSDVVNELYGHIIRDDRHVDVTLLAYSDIHRRSFAKWAMAYIRADEVDSMILRKYCTQRAFDPFAMSAQQALGFLAEIATEREALLEKRNAAG
jgi:hypothetical protein